VALALTVGVSKADISLLLPWIRMAGWSVRYTGYVDPLTDLKWTEGASCSNTMSEDYDWSADIAKLPMPVLLVFADNDSVSQKHIAEFFALLGGGVREPGWLNTQLSKSRLAVVPGYSHYNFITSAHVPQIIGKFLADPLTNAPAGAAAASQAAPPPEKKQ
jgi:pimeloyl-ACP methyl ester carboxylesterase